MSNQVFTFPVQFQSPVTVSQGLTGTFYGDGSNLVGASLPGQQEVNSIVQQTSGNTLFLNDYIQDTVNDAFGIYLNQAEDSYTTVRNNSATTWNYQGTDLKALTGKYEDTSTVVQTNSANWDTSYQGMSQFKTKLTDQTTSGEDDNYYTDDTIFFTAEANTMYFVELNYFLTSNYSGPNWKFTLTPNTSAFGEFIYDTESQVIVGKYYTINGEDFVPEEYGIVAGGLTLVRGKFYIKTGNAGNIGMSFKVNFFDDPGNTAYAKAGSWIKYKKLI